MNILPAAPQDLETIRAIAAQTWPAAYGAILSQGQIAYMLELFYSRDALFRQLATGHQFLLAVENGTPIGFADYELNFEAATAKLQKLYVLPQAQGAGAGKKLLEAVVTAAHQAGQQRLILNVNRHNKALHFYQKHGFTILREEDIDIGEDYFMNDYILGLKLTSV